MPRNRSSKQSDEANLDVLDRSFAAQQTRLFETDKRRSRQVTLDKGGGLNFANPMQQRRSVKRRNIRLPAMKRGMTFLHRNEGAAARRTNFFVCAQGSLHRRSVFG
jgi:hypothetical protein